MSFRPGQTVHNDRIKANRCSFIRGCAANREWRCDGEGRVWSRFNVLLSSCGNGSGFEKEVTTCTRVVSSSDSTSFDHDLEEETDGGSNALTGKLFIIVVSRERYASTAEAEILL